jgi:hypothetical protein
LTRRPRDFLHLSVYPQHIVDAVARVRSYTTGMTFDAQIRALPWPSDPST